MSDRSMNSQKTRRRPAPSEKDEFGFQFSDVGGDRPGGVSDSVPEVEAAGGLEAGLVLGQLVDEPLTTSEISAAALVRSIPGMSRPDHARSSRHDMR
jgi:hypothetical protein